MHHCDIPVETNIGKGIRFGHGALGIVIHETAVVGSDCWIMQNVTIGNKDDNSPIIEDHVLIGAGAVVLGKVKVGRGSVIGANAVVLSDIPPYEVWGGVPAKRIKTIINGEKFPYFD